MKQEVEYLVIGINYSPEPTGNAPYTTDLAEFLSKKGSTRVITGIPHYPWWEKKQADDSVILGELELRRRQHTVPKGQGNLGRALMEVTFGLSVVLGGGLVAKTAILVSPAMLSSALISLWLKAFHKRTKRILWVQDLYEEGLRETGARLNIGSRLVIHAERWLLRSAHQVVFAHEGFINAKRNLGLNNTSLVPNWSQFSHSENEKPKMQFDRRMVLHIGNMGVKQGLENVVKAARLAESRTSPVIFVLLGAGNQLSSLRTMAGDCKALRFVEPVSNRELSSYLNSADILLVNEKPGVKEMSMPSKLTTYFQTGKPVLVCSERDSLAAKEVLSHGIGYWTASGSPEGLLRAVTELDLDKAKKVANSARLYSELKLSKDLALANFLTIIESSQKG